MERKEFEVEYEKPEVLAQNAEQGSFAAGCPEESNISPIYCRKCERTR